MLNEHREMLLMSNGDAVLGLPSEKAHGSNSGREAALRVWEDEHILAADNAAQRWCGTMRYRTNDEPGLRAFPGIATPYPVGNGRKGATVRAQAHSG